MDNMMAASIVLSIFCCLLSAIIIVCLLASGFNFQDNRQRTFLFLLICNIAALASDALAVGFSGGTEVHNFIIVRVGNFVSFVFGYLITICIFSYCMEFIETKDRTLRIATRTTQIICGIAILTVIISQFNHMYYTFDENNIYQRQGMFWLTQAFGVGFMFINTAAIIRYRKELGRRNFWFLLSYYGIMFVAISIQTVFYGLPLYGVGVTFSLVIIYIGIQSELAKEIKIKELELAQSQTAVMLSQIQPHFLYNSLVAIQRLCTKDPKLAGEAVVQFSIYLRGNMDSLTYKKNIPFEKELVHLENYLALEKKRFGDKLNIVYDISVSNFYLPSLTVQPIVENAVRHGITKRDEESGTLTISTSENKTDIMITVTDDGVGFDTSKPKDDGRQHIGIENVRSRLASMCGGTITVHSKPDVGTTAIIKIPKGDL